MLRKEIHDLVLLSTLLLRRNVRKSNEENKSMQPLPGHGDISAVLTNKLFIFTQPNLWWPNCVYNNSCYSLTTVTNVMQRSHCEKLNGSRIKFLVFRCWNFKSSDGFKMFPFSHRTAGLFVHFMDAISFSFLHFKIQKRQMQKVRKSKVW